MTVIVMMVMVGGFAEIPLCQYHSSFGECGLAEALHAARTHPSVPSIALGCREPRARLSGLKACGCLKSGISDKGRLPASTMLVLGTSCTRGWLR